MLKNFATVIMAAGKGTRMKNSEKAKVMFEVAGKPMIQHVVDLAAALDSSRVIAVVGFYRESVTSYLHRTSPFVEFAVQEPQLGTGHAVMQAEKLLTGFHGNVLGPVGRCSTSSCTNDPRAHSIPPSKETCRYDPYCRSCGSVSGMGESFGATTAMLSASSSTRTRPTTKGK